MLYYHTHQLIASYYVCVFFRICKWRLAVVCSKRSLTKDYLRACIFSSDGSILKSGKRAKKKSLENNYSVMSLAIAAAFSRTEKIIYIPFSFSSSQIKKEILSGMKTFFLISHIYSFFFLILLWYKKLIYKKVLQKWRWLLDQVISYMTT